MPRKKYTPEFKIEAVKLVTDKKYTVAQAAREAGINESLLSKWKRQYLAEQNGTIPTGSKPITPDMQYIRALENRIRELEEDNEILKKSHRDFNLPKAQRYQQISSLKSHGIKRLCKLFGVSERACYDWRQTAQCADKYASLKLHIRSVHAEGRQAPGKRTIRHLLRNKGIEVGVYVVSKLMKEMALVSKQPVKKANHTGGKPHCLFENHLQRKFDRKEGGSAVLCGDVTYIQVNGQWHYLAAVLDLKRRRLAVWRDGGRRIGLCGATARHTGDTV